MRHERLDSFMTEGRLAVVLKDGRDDGKCEYRAAIWQFIVRVR